VSFTTVSRIALIASSAGEMCGTKENEVVGELCIADDGTSSTGQRVAIRVLP